MGTPKMLILLLGLAALVVGAVAALALDNWWILVVVMALHAVASAVVIGYSFAAASQDEDKPDAVTQARIEDDDEPSMPTPGREGDGPRDREVFS